MDMQSFIRSIYTNATTNIERLEAALKTESDPAQREKLLNELASNTKTLNSF